MFEIALQTTTFIKWDGTRIVLPNSYLFANILSNLTRSNDKGEVFKVSAPALLYASYKLGLQDLLKTWRTGNGGVDVMQHLALHLSVSLQSGLLISKLQILTLLIGSL